MLKNQIGLRNIQVGGWIGTLRKGVVKDPFLVVLDDGVNFYGAQSENPDDNWRGRIICGHSLLSRRAGIAEIPSDKEVALTVAAFNELTQKKRESQLHDRPDLCPDSDLMIELALNPVHPCKVEVHNFKWDRENKKVLAYNPDEGLSPATIAARNEMQAKYPGFYVFICYPIDATYMGFRCPRCGTTHVHGREDGLRDPHCDYTTTYVVVEKRP